MPATEEPRSRGQALVELALVTPILLVLLLGTVDLGRLFYAQIAVTNAAREGATVAAITPGSFSSGAACDATTNAVTCAATRDGQGGFVTVSAADVAMSCNPSCAKAYGNSVTVTVTGYFQTNFIRQPLTVGECTAAMQAAGTCGRIPASVFGAYSVRLSN